MCEIRDKLLSDADRAIWASYARLVAPLPGHELPVVPAAPQGQALAPGVVRHRQPAPVTPVAIGAHPAGVDGGTWQRFRTGKLPATRTLDLHGHTAQRAFHALGGFLRAAYADRVRCVEVITGRGSGEHGGVIRRELPMWLNSPQTRPLVLAAAHPHAANPGSVRLLLRRRRSG
jgi:DNA-nicking Smr family endonuclease